MTTFYIKSKIKKIVLVFILFTSAMLCFAETNLEKADSYYDKDSYSVAKIYYEYSLFNDNVSNGKLFYRLGYSYEQLKINKSIYPKLYSAAAYCFERDNDKENKYYSYAISKEKDFGVNHNNYSDETIQKITEELYWKTHKKNFTYLRQYPKELIWYSIMFIILLLMIVALIDVIIKHFKKYKYYLKNIEIDLSELFKGDYYVNPTPDFMNQLQNSYNNMVKWARYGSTIISKPENFLLYKFGQVIFTKNGNEVDYKTVTKGLKQVFFTETNTVESTNLKINFINKFNEFYHKWCELQKLYNERLYELPELGILLSVLYTKMETDTFIKNANNVIDVSNDFEEYRIRKYRDNFIVIANKIYHEKTEENDLSRKISFELNTITNKFSNKFKLATGKFFKLIVNYLPIILFIYVLVFFFHTSSLSIINFLVTGICCFILYKIKSKRSKPFATTRAFNRLMTKAEREALDREIKEQVERDKARRSREQEQKTYSSSSNNYHEYEDSESVDNSQEFSRNQRCQTQEKPQYNEKPKSSTKKCFCRYCGREYSRVSDLTNYSCARHPSGPNKGKHSLYHGDTNPPFYCKYCGREYSRLSDLTSYSCTRHPNGPNKGKHAPYEGFQKDPWICDNCGRTYSRLSDLTSYSCTKSPLGPNKGKHIPAN